MTCEYCKGSPMPGIHCPTNWDDREPSRNGMVFVARCDSCWHNRAVPHYNNDLEAAEAVSKATGWPIQKSYDRIDDFEAGTNLFRPYFAVTLKEAEEKIG